VQRDVAASSADVRERSVRVAMPSASHFRNNVPDNFHPVWKRPKRPTPWDANDAQSEMQQRTGHDRLEGLVRDNRVEIRVLFGASSRSPRCGFFVGDGR
jgi:hypothetical protein